MPRKQRFKPSRKPQQANQGVVTSPQIDRGDSNPDAQHIEKAAPERQPMAEAEVEPR